MFEHTRPPEPEESVRPVGYRILLVLGTGLGILAGISLLADLLAAVAG